MRHGPRANLPSMVPSLKGSTRLSERVQASKWYIHRPQGKDMGTPLEPRYVAYRYMVHLGNENDSTCSGTPDNSGNLLESSLVQISEGIQQTKTNYTCTAQSRTTRQTLRCARTGKRTRELQVLVQLCVFLILAPPWSLAAPPLAHLRWCPATSSRVRLQSILEMSSGQSHQYVHMKTHVFT